jgi:hypothetical protein
LIIPAIVSALMDDTAIASTVASPTPPHLKELLLIRLAREASACCFSMNCAQDKCALFADPPNS